MVTDQGGELSRTPFQILSRRVHRNVRAVPGFPQRCLVIASITAFDERPAEAESRWAMSGSTRASCHADPSSLRNICPIYRVEPPGAPLRPKNMEPPMIAHTFGTGFGETHTWHAPADADLNGDGRLDSVRLDFDGDGLADDAMIDADGDGVAEYAALDLDDDGTPDTYFTDTGNGVGACAVRRRRGSGRWNRAHHPNPGVSGGPSTSTATAPRRDTGDLRRRSSRTASRHRRRRPD